MLVLLLIAICGAIASQIVSRVVRLSGQAADAQRELQHRWAAVSIRRTALNTASKLLTNQENSIERPLAKRSFSILLGKARYNISVHDESAKLPLIQTIARFPMERAKEPIRALVGNQAIVKSIIPKHPTMLSDIVDRPEYATASESLRSWESIAQQLTLWSDGRINVRAADKETLDQLWQLRFNGNAPAELMAYRELPNASVFTDTFRALGLSSAQTQFAMEWLTTESNTYSLWVDSTNNLGSSFTAIYVRRRSLGFADEQFGYHYP
ncbi:MAG: hypothetical protein ABL921_30795 [Pirellula sp.]